MGSSITALILAELFGTNLIKLRVGSLALCYFLSHTFGASYFKLGTIKEAQLLQQEPLPLAQAAFVGELAGRLPSST